MTTFKIRREETRDGQIALIAHHTVFASKRPVVVMIHGALRHFKVLAHWHSLLVEEADVVFIELPGHGRSTPVHPPSVDSFAVNILQAIQSALSGRDVVVVGESLGGLVALVMAGMSPAPIRAVLAVDPPLTTGKLWHVAASLLRAIDRDPDDQYLRSWVSAIFGMSPHGRGDRIYYPVLSGVSIPAHIVTGDLPLLPPRVVRGIPCVLDRVDRFVIENLYADQIRFHVIQDCGHLLLVDQTGPCLELIRRIQSGRA
ncbi:MAG: alpha/beta hydrolase [Phenylobacterium sp.]|nr:alpha/beta hydrolase [Phenylobacterium sp.]